MAHQDFVRQLARSLVSDANSAADIAQETWLTALKRPPESPLSIKSWLSTVTRNVTRMLYRGEARRVKREKSAARPEFVQSTEEVVEREEIRTKVVEAVLRLKEPYRSAILLRYYQDLTPKEISDRFEIPLPTVNSRLRRGIEQLRGEFDAHNNGDRSRWLTALAPIAGMNVGTPASAVAGSVVTFLGMLLMSAKIKVGAACVLVLGAALTIGSYLQETTSIPQQNVEMDSAIQGYSKDHHSEETESADKREILQSTADNRQYISPASSGINLSGRVTDKVTKKPVTAFYARLTWQDEEVKYRFIDDTERWRRAGLRCC